MDTFLILYSLNIILNCTGFIFGLFVGYNSYKICSIKSSLLSIFLSSINFFIIVKNIIELVKIL